jgi:putative ABC transport system permease protein
MRIAFRRLLKARLFTVFAILSLGVGLSLTTTIYSIIRSVLFDGIGIPEPDRVGFVITPYDGRLLKGSVSEPDFRTLVSSQSSFSAVAASAPLRIGLSSATGAELVTAEGVDGEYFSVMRVQPALGRLLQASDAERRVAVIAKSVWTTRFGSDPAILGRSIQLDGVSVEVIGVVPGSFAGVNGKLGGTRVWLPLAAGRALSGHNTADNLIVLGRLKPSVSVDTAGQELRALATVLDAASPPATAASARRWSLKTAEAIAREDVILSRIGSTLVGLVTLVLIVACTNLSNLVLARGTVRQADLAVRRALGASRAQLVWEQFRESLILGVGGVSTAIGLFFVLRAALHTEFFIRLPGGEPLTLEIRPELDPVVASAALVALAISLIVFGLEPAWRLTRALDLRTALGAAAGLNRNTLRRQHALLRWQVTVSACFFIIATMFARYTILEARHDPGVRLDGLAVAAFDFAAQGWDGNRIKPLIQRLLVQADANPAVTATALATALPFGTRHLMRLTLGEMDRLGPGMPAVGISATPSLFAVLEIPIVRGRAFAAADAEDVVVINETAARRMFGAADVVNRRLSVTRGTQRRDVTVVGVARDTDVGQILFEPMPLAYFPLSAGSSTSLVVVARAPQDAAHHLRDLLARTDPALAAEAIGDGRSMLSGPWLVLRGAGIGALVLGGVTLVLAMAGLFGIQTHAVLHRTREIGIRMAMGATSRDIRRFVLREGYRPVLEGLAIGSAIGLAGRAIVRSYLDLDVPVIDVAMLLLAAAALIAAAFWACDAPARRAAGVNPMVALRAD